MFVLFTRAEYIFRLDWNFQLKVLKESWDSVKSNRCLISVSIWLNNVGKNFLTLKFILKKTSKLNLKFLCGKVNIYYTIHSCLKVLIFPLKKSAVAFANINKLDLLPCHMHEHHQPLQSVKKYNPLLYS